MASAAGPGARWSHRGAIQDALGMTVLEAGNGPPTLSHPDFALFGRHSGPAPPNQPPLPRMRIDAAQRELSRDNGERFLAPGYACVPRAERLRRYRGTVLSKGPHFRYKGDDGLWWLGKISASATEDGVYLVRFLEDPGTIKLSLPGAVHDFNGGRTRFLVPPGPRSQRVPSGDQTERRLISWRGHG